MDDLESCMNAMRSCLSEKGKIMASMFFAKDSSDPKKHTQKGFVAKLEELGFKVTVMNGDDLCGSFLANVCGIGPKDIIIIAEPTD